MPEILPGVHQILVNYGGRPLKLYLLIGPTASLLMDVGDPPVPEKDVVPYMRSIGFVPTQLCYVMITHPDTDHSAGLAAIKRVAPGARLTCGTADRQQVESPLALVDLRGRVHCARHHVGPDGDERTKALARSGEFTPVDLTFSGGETIRLGPGDGPLDVVEVMHLPGHSHGHLGVYIPAYHSAIIGDAVHDVMSPDLQGRPALPVTYMYIDEYLGTLARLKAMRLEQVYSAHWPDCRTREQVDAWLDLSRDYAVGAEKAILDLVRQSKEGVTLAELLMLIKPALGTWPANRDSASRFFVAGHLERLEAHGTIAGDAGIPMRYRAR